jgi:hypothetical protein
VTTTVLTVLATLLVIFVLIFVALGAVSVWTRDEHQPRWIPPAGDPVTGVKKLPPVYDHEDEEANWTSAKDRKWRERW